MKSGRLVLSIGLIGILMLVVMMSAPIADMSQIVVQALSSYTENNSALSLPLASVTEDNIWLYGFTDDPQQMTDDTFQEFSSLVWSPDGSHLAFIAMDENLQSSLWLSDSLNSDPVQLADELVTGLPISFTLDNAQVLYGSENPDEAFLVDVYSMGLSPNALPELLGQFTFQTGCGGGSPFPHNQMYQQETGYDGNVLVMTLTPFGLVHSIDCSGTGIGILNLETGEDILLDPSLRRVAVSSDRMQLLGISEDILTLVDLATQTITSITTDSIPDQVAWGALDTGDIFFSTRQETGDFIGLTADELHNFWLAQGYEEAVEQLPISEVTIHQLNLETDTDTALYTQEAYAIGRMIITPDNNILLFSQIPGLGDWARDIAEDSSDLANTAATAAVQTELFRLSLASDDLKLVGSDMEQVALNGPAYIRQHGIEPVISVTPAAGSVNTQITVNGQGFPPNTRVLVFLGRAKTNMDTNPYAAGFADANGNISIGFNMPGVWEDGNAVTEGQVNIQATTADQAYSASANFTISAPTTTASGAGSAIHPVVSISPVSGPVNTQVNINLRGFPADSRVNVHLGPASTGPTTDVYASAFTNAFGITSLTFNIPAVYADGTTIRDTLLVIQVATDDQQVSANLLFSYVLLGGEQASWLPGITVSPTTVTVDTQVHVSGHGFPANSVVNVLMGPSSVDLRGVYRVVTLDKDGNFQTNFIMPDRWPDGTPIIHTYLAIMAITTDGQVLATANLGYTPPATPSTPTHTPTVRPTEVPSVIPTQPIATPTVAPTVESTTDPTVEPTEESTAEPTVEPTEEQEEPTVEPTEDPVVEPTDEVEEPTTPVTPALNVYPISGGANTLVTVSGDNLPVNTEVTIVLSDGFNSAGYWSTATDSDGVFNLEFTVPETWDNGGEILSDQLEILAITVDGITSASTSFTYMTN